MADSSFSDTKNHQTEPNEPPQHAFVISFILGPPTRGVDAIAFAEVAAQQGLTRQEFWHQVVRRNITQLLECDPEGRSKLDAIVSEALGETVAVWEAGATVGPFGDLELPGLAVNPNMILDVLGRRPRANVADREALSRIADGLMDFTRADLSICTLTAENGEIIFPFPRRATRKETYDA